MPQKLPITDERLLDYYRGRPCDFCGKPGPSDPHHVEPKGMGGGRRLDVALNIVSACRPCHQRYQADRAAGFAVIEKREGLAPGQAQEAIWRLLRKGKP